MVAQLSPLTYEDQTQTIAQQLLAASSTERSFLAQMRDQLRWDDKVLAWAMENPHLRVQMFRLIDCLPSLRSKAEIARHLQEYLGDASVELPSLLKNLLNFTQVDSIAGQLAATTLSTAVEALAHRYIAGATLKQVTKTLESLRKDRMTFTLDLLGEAVITETEAAAYLNRYLDLMEHLSATAKTWPTIPEIDLADGIPLPRVQVSVKLTAFYSQFDPLDATGSQARVSERIRVLLRRANHLGVAVHFDMEQYAYKSLTLQILKDLLLEEEFRIHTDIGVTLQAYLRDSIEDLQDLIKWAKQRAYPITVRLVKGAYWDQETIKSAQKDWPQPVFNQKAATDANFERMTQLLLEHHAYLYAAIGSHNVRSAAHAIAMAKALKIPSRAFELQVLYGMADKLAKALCQQGYRLRVYCPYGELIPGMAYLIRRLLENTANSSFLRQSLQGMAAETLLAPPQTPADESKYNPQVSGFVGVPDTDFSDPILRHPYADSLRQVRQQLGRSYWPLIKGAWVQTEQTLDSVNPSRYSEVVGKIGMASLDQANQAVAAAKSAFTSWKNTPVTQRAAILRQAATMMQHRRRELSAWIVLEVGKPLREADAEVSEAIDFCRFYAQEMERLDHPYDRTVPGETNHYRYHPRGIVAVISPWNFPLSIACGMTVAALVAGNCAILKPASQSAVVAAKLAEILVEAGMPAGVFQYLPGNGSQLGPFLTKHPDIHMIAFTGSQEVGCEIYANAALLQPGQHHMKRVIAEMGGKNGIIVDESADLDQAVKGVVHSAFGYSGQKCSACSRVIVLEPIFDSFVTRLVEATRSLQVGEADHPATQVGPVIDASAQQRIREGIQRALSYAKPVLETPAPDGGFFIGPTILSEVPADAEMAQQEFFGPVLAVIRAKDFDQALSIANGTVYGLTGGIYSRTPSHIEQARSEFAVGNLYINRTITGAIVDRQPFGGFNLSGVGSKAGGPDYVLQFLEPRTVSENVQRQGFAPIEGAE